MPPTLKERIVKWHLMAMIISDLLHQQNIYMLLWDDVYNDIPVAPVSGMIDLNFLYEEFKGKLIGQDHLMNELHKLIPGYYDLKNKYNDLERESVEGFRDMRANYDSVITTKDKQVADEDHVIEEYNERLWALVTNHERANTNR